MITHRKATERGHSRIDWLDSWHTFSFSDYYDPKFTGFRDLLVLNESRVLPARLWCVREDTGGLDMASTTSLHRRIWWWVWFAAVLALADVLLAAWWLGSSWTMAACVVAIAALIVWAAWAGTRTRLA